MRRFALLAIASLWSSAIALAGVDLGGNLPTHLWRPNSAAAQRFTLQGQLKAVRWVNQTGRSVTRPVGLPLDGTLELDAPAGSWTDVELIFEGAPRLNGRELPMRELVVALDEPLDTAGGVVWLVLDGTALDGLPPGWTVEEAAGVIGASMVGSIQAED